MSWILRKNNIQTNKKIVSNDTNLREEYTTTNYVCPIHIG